MSYKQGADKVQEGEKLLPPDASKEGVHGEHRTSVTSVATTATLGDSRRGSEKTTGEAAIGEDKAKSKIVEAETADVAKDVGTVEPKRVSVSFGEKVDVAVENVEAKKVEVEKSVETEKTEKVAVKVENVKEDKRVDAEERVEAPKAEKIAVKDETVEESKPRRKSMRKMDEGDSSPIGGDIVRSSAVVREFIQDLRPSTDSSQLGPFEMRRLYGFRGPHRMEGDYAIGPEEMMKILPTGVLPYIKKHVAKIEKEFQEGVRTGRIKPATFKDLWGWLKGGEMTEEELWQQHRFTTRDAIRDLTGRSPTARALQLGRDRTRAFTQVMIGTSEQYKVKGSYISPLAMYQVQNPTSARLCFDPANPPMNSPIPPWQLSQQDNYMQKGSKTDRLVRWHRSVPLASTHKRYRFHW